jgi:hypothetical protein
MDVADQLQEIGFVFTDDRFIAILKEMPISLVAAVEGYGMPGHEASHDTTQMNAATSEQEMEMVRKQGPCIAADSCRIQDISEAGQKILVIVAVPENPAPLNSPGHDMLKKAGGIDSGLARHGF